MGSWNETCAISHLPIQCGEKVRAFFLTTGHYKTFPRTMAVKGSYADYGEVELDMKHPTTELFCHIAVEQLKKDYIDHKVSYGEEKTPINSWGQAWEAATRENLLVNLSHDNPVDMSRSQLSFEFDKAYTRKVEPEPVRVHGLMILESVWQMILNLEYKNPMWISDRREGMTRQELKADIKTYFKTSFESILRHYAFETFDEIYPALAWSRDKKQSFVDWTQVLESYFRYPFALGGDYFPYHILGMLVKNEIKFTDESYNAALDEIVDFFWINIFLHDIRKELLPTAGRGSQSYQVESAFRFHRGVAKISLDKHKADWLERQEWMDKDEKAVDPLKSFYKQFKQ